jgi:hypothetical protein
MCRTTNPGGGGSSPPVRANSSGCRGAWPSLPALEAGDRWFESTHPDQFDEQSCFKSNLLQVFVLMHDLIRKVCNFSGSCISSVGRAPLSESGCPRFKSATGCQSTRCPSGQGALCKSADAGSIPALVSRLQWLERKGTDLLNRQMLVRIQPGAPRVQCFHGRAAQRMSADFLHRRMHVRFVSRSPIRRVNWAGAQRRLLSDRPARR